MQIAESSGAVAGASGHQSQQRISPRCGASLNTKESETQMAGESLNQHFPDLWADEERPWDVHSTAWVHLIKQTPQEPSLEIDTLLHRSFPRAQRSGNKLKM